MKPYALGVQVDGPQEYQNVPVNHTSIQTSIERAIKLGWGNERICRVIGMPNEIVDKVRHRLKKENERK